MARIVFALLIALVGMLGYCSRQSTNEVTGERQYVALDPEQEVALGLQSAPQMAAQFGGPDPDPELQAYVRGIGQKIVQSSNASKAPYQYSFTVLRDPETINAFALPGGPIFVTRGLLALMENEAQLAGVLGHEIGHVVARHSAEHLAKSELAQTMAGAAGVAASERTGMGGYMIASFVAQMAQLQYGRKDELESDTLGVRYMADAGYDPRAMLGVMDILANAGGRGGQPEFMSSHPNPGNRQATIRDAIAKEFPNGVPAGLTMGQQFQRARSTAAGAGSW